MKRNCVSDCAYRSSKCIMLFPPTLLSSLIHTFLGIHRFLAQNLAMAIFQTVATRRRMHASAGKRRNACKAAVLYPSKCYNTTLLVSFELCRNQFLLRYVQLCLLALTIFTGFHYNCQVSMLYSVWQLSKVS